MNDSVVVAVDGGLDRVVTETIRVRILPDGRMTRQDTARYLGLAEKTLAMWAMEEKGPRVVRVGGRCFYFKADCDAFIRGDAA